MPPLRRPVCGSGPHKWSKDTKEGRLRMHRILIKSEAQQTSSSSFRPSSAKECRVRFVFFPRNVTQHNRRVEAELRFSNAEKGGRIRRRRWSSRFCGVGVELEISSRVRPLSLLSISSVGIGMCHGGRAARFQAQLDSRECQRPKDFGCRRRRRRRQDLELLFNFHGGRGEKDHNITL